MKKRLLLITNGFPFGQSERSFLTEESKQLAEEFDLLILALDNRDELLYSTDGIQRIERYSIPSFRKNCSFGAIKRFLEVSTLHEVWQCAKKNRFKGLAEILIEILYFRFEAWEMERQIGALVESEKIDIVYTYWCTGATLGAVKLKKRFPHLKVITRFHGVDLYEERKDINWQPFREKIAREADGLCFACEYGRSYFAQHWGAEHTRKMYISYLGSTDRGSLPFQKAQQLQIISCSNLIPLKRVELIIKGLALLPKTMNVAWDIFGDGTEREMLEKMAAEAFGDCPNILWKFHGQVCNTELDEEYRKLSPQLFITTSSTEGGAPVSIQEVFSMGIPAIGTRVGGIPDLILEGKTGYLLPEQAEPTHVAEAILRFAALTDEEKQIMRDAVRRHWAEKFDAKKNAVQFAAYLQELVSK